MEDLHASFSALCRSSGWNVPTVTKHENQSLQSLTTDWSSAQIEKMQSLESDALQRFDYEAR